MTERAPSSKHSPLSPSIERQGMSLLGGLASVLLFAAALYVLYRIAGEVKPADVVEAFRKAGNEQIGLAVIFTVASYLFLTGYDALAMRQLAIKAHPARVAFASFTSYAVSFTLGFPWLTAGTVRYWIYSSAGISSSKVASLTLIAGMTFILGMAVVFGIGLIWQSEAISLINQANASVNQLIGMAVISGILVYLVWTAAKRRHMRIKRFLIELPTLRVSLGQLALGAADVCAAAAVLYVLLPEGHGITFETFAAIYAFACILGVVSNAPGGLGVFEATILLAFHNLPREGVIGALLLFRLCYYLGPFVIAVASLALYEIVIRFLRFRARVNGPETDD
ncbi:MAG: lysylphosphatidylglycerol synthase domain-containing protein [Alphaproteobacteria bacterium]